MTILIFLIVLAIAVFIILYRNNSNSNNVYKFINKKVGALYDRYAPYSFKVVREKVKELGQEYTPRQYAIQVIVFAVGAAVVTYLYFYNIIVSIIYAIAAVAVIPYLTYLRCKRLYSEFIFEQIQVYTTNTIMEFATTQSFVKALEGVYSSNVLEDPVKSDVKMMIDLAYENGTIEQSIEYMNSKYDYFIVRNMHQLFLQITNEGAKDSGESLENMSQDIDMLVESVYRDRIDRATFHKKFLQFGILLYLMVMLVQFMLGIETYNQMLEDWWVVLLLHGIIWLNTYFILSGEKYYNEDVGAE
ncbi:MAG TPA: hypothetical protein IAB27_00445 [Candidatus Coprosoma intestinipullorum]|uniref:Flp pilus assembly protein TadB n=1 Tax=Candidatus Coprosoma intestinipullorum TaxID=2840752 RepID=A0A9D0ZRD7_9FIRM|nr:hypothetical protein [Candidatus Coprosoma intestinipullorum]